MTENLLEIKREKLAKDREKVIDEIKKGLEEQWGIVPLVVSEMAKFRPDVVIPDMIAATEVYEHPKALDTKTVWLVAFGIATALRSEYCMDVAAAVAKKLGATSDELRDVAMIAAYEARGTMLAYSLRSILRVEEEMKK